ncbi:hypothetical protein PLESTF_000737800 [Pleodorina starrii]|nr:hypothetical protein PLESTF_000737800 [Pleodorina starrii]
MCVPVAGCALGRAFLDLHPPFDPAARRADALLAGFPCGEGSLSQLAFTLRTGAVLDPRPRLRLYDLNNLAYLSAQLLTLAIGIAVPSLYVRCRHFLFLAIHLASLLGAYLSTAFAPDGLLLLGVAAVLSSGRCLIPAIYFSWKSAAVLQLPSSLQLFVGPTMWLIFLWVTSAVDRRVTPSPSPPGDTVQHPHVGTGPAALLFVVIAVLPYLAARFYERHWLLPQYRAYLRSCGAEAEGGTGAGVGGIGGSASADDCSGRGRLYREINSPSSSPAGPQQEAAEAMAGHPYDQHQQQHQHQQPDSCREALTLAAAAIDAVPLYRSASGRGRTVVVDFKIPLPPGCSFDIAAARLSAAAVAKLNARLTEAQLGLAADLPQPDGGGGDGGGEPADGKSRRRRRRNLLRLQSLVCVEGCVQLLAVVQAVGQEVPAEPSSGGPLLRSDRIHTRQARLGLPAADASGYPADEDARVDTADFNAALEGLLDELEYGGSDGDDEAVQGPCPTGGALPPLLWPPVLRRLDEGSDAAGGIGCDGSGDGDTVLVLLPTGGTAVRCVVVGPVGRCHHQQQELYLDEELQAEELLPADAKCGDSSQREDGEGGSGGSEAAYRAVRIRLPPAARAASGVLSLHLLLPRAAADRGPPQTTADSSPPPPPALSAELSGSAAAAAAAADSSVATAAAAAAPNTELLATLPLLVLPDEAAEEVRHLYRSSLFEGGESFLSALDQFLVLPPTSAAGGPSSQSSAGVGPTAQTLTAAATAAAAAAQHDSGLLSLAYDMGRALGEQYGSARPPVTLTFEAAGQLTEPFQQQPPTDPRVKSHLFWFLENRGMTACLRECHSAIEGARTAVMYSRDASGSLAAAALPAGPSATEGARRHGTSPSGTVPAASGGPATTVVPDTAGSSNSAATAAAAAAAGARLRSPASGGGSSGNVPAGRRSSSSRSEAPTSAADAGGARRRRSGLRSLLFGFWPPDLESAYQDFKAAQCCQQLDRAAPVMQLIIVTSALIHTFSAAMRQPPSTGGGGGGGPQQRQLYLQALSQVIYILVSIAVPSLLARVTTFDGRLRRNRLLLLRALLDYGTKALILMPGPWGDSLLTAPDVWIVFLCRRHGLLLYRGIWEPLVFQLSPRLAIWPALSSLMYTRLLTRPCFGGRWRPALLLAVCTSSCHLAISAATDSITRRKFLRARAAAAEAAVRGDGGGGAVSGGHHQKQAAARCCSDEE